MNGAIVPPATIGIVGGGQLGMMTIREAHRIGYRSIVWDPDEQCPASRLADAVVTAPFDDMSMVESFARRCDVITFEFENVDSRVIRELGHRTPLYPGIDILEISQNRKREKEELRSRGFSTVDFRCVTSSEEISRAVDEMGFPAVIKTATAGYDGKGQAVLRDGSDLAGFLKGMKDDGRMYVVEKFADVFREVSVIAARGHDGSVVAFPVSENEHRENILHVTRLPARIHDRMEKKALALGKDVIANFGIVGMLCVEMFITREGNIVVNELAPRPHNSGHYSLDSCTVSQFELLIRSICGLPLPAPRLLSPCAMINILGKHMERLDISALLQMEGIKLHLYGKTRVEPRRKMGHVTIVRETKELVEKGVGEIEQMLMDE